MVENQKMGVTRASKKLRIKIPTAKVILSTFRRKGVVFKKKHEDTPLETPGLCPPSPAAPAELASPPPISQLDPSALVYYCPIVYLYPAQWQEGIFNF
jgi:hypothetical protein